MKKNFLLIFATCISLFCTAQTHDLSAEELAAFKSQCLERIDAFQMGLEIIADKQQDLNIKQHYINTLPDMFLAKGERWTDINGEIHSAVTMQTAVKKSKGVIEYDSKPLKTYLYNLRNLRWKQIKISKAKTCMISNFYKRSENLYEATATFYQYMEGYGNEGYVYRDKTQKDVKIYISRVEDGQLGTYWDMKFGDINVSAIE